jgi:protein-S-isoprenylcysteine O-methyltransferase Ste14
MLLIWLLQALYPWPEPDANWIRIVGWGIVITSGLLAESVLVSLRRSNTTTDAAGTPATLLTAGAFAWSRNPYYLACAILLAGLATATGFIAALVVPLFYMVVIDRLVIPAEEATLLAAFGQEYAEYQRTVRRWI